MMIPHVFLPLITGLVTTFLLEYGLNPRPLPVWKRPFASVLIHIGLWHISFALLLLLLQRPWFAVVNLLALQLLLVLVNQAKFASLREPFIFQDFEYFTDAIKYPRLYLPFFGIARTIAATIGFIGAFIIGLVLEPSLLGLSTLPAFVSICLALLLFGLPLVHLGLNNCPPIAFHPATDLKKLGQLAFFCIYWSMERIKLNLDDDNSLFLSPPAESAQALPHIIAVQSESFFDPRGLSDTIKPSVLTQFDEARSESCQYGRLQVPAWGANTVRTEGGFLSGLAPEQLGIHQFNPYRLFSKHSVPNLAGYLKQAGYRTLCIHPYHAGFYLRDHVFPRLGFDEFIDLNGFDDRQKCGQFIGDVAIADKIQALLEAASQPLFIFVITMENHGPLHLEQADVANQDRFYSSPPNSVLDDLTVYLQHLQNADQMIKQLKDSLLASQRGGLLCWYGDHVPIMASVYQHLGEPDGLTDYFIWQTKQGQGEPINHNIPIHELAALLLKYSGLIR
jgi:hypothetical protein